MTVTVPPQDLARALGIQDDSPNFLPGDKAAATKVSDLLLKMTIPQVETFWLDFSAAYLPQFLVWFQEGPYDPLCDAHLAFLGVLATSLLRSHMEKLVRERPDEAAHFFQWCLFVLASFPMETFQAPQLLSHLHLTLILLETTLTTILTHISPPLFIPDPSSPIAQHITSSLTLTLPHFIHLAKASPSEHKELEVRLKEVAWVVEDDQEGALWKRQAACVKAGWLHWWRCPSENWVKRDGGGEEVVGGRCRQIESEDDWKWCLGCECERYCSEEHLRSESARHEPLCVRPQW